MAVLRRAGSPWRILVHEWIGRKGEDGLLYGKQHDITNDPGAAARNEKTRQWLAGRTGKEPPYYGQTVVLPGTEFDELVIGRWIHLEQMDTGYWWMNIGGVTVHVRADRDGRPEHVTVYGPGDYDEAVPGCKYECDWSRENDD